MIHSSNYHMCFAHVISIIFWQDNCIVKHRGSVLSNGGPVWKVRSVEKKKLVHTNLSVVKKKKLPHLKKHATPWVNFIKLEHTAYCANLPKYSSSTSWSTFFLLMNWQPFAVLGSSSIKAVRKHIDEIDPISPFSREKNIKLFFLVFSPQHHTFPVDG